MNLPESTPASPCVAARASRWATLATIIAVLLSCVLATRRMYCTPYCASDLHIKPDAIEYAVCAQRIATLGRYDMDFNGESLPPHSTPWFSMLLAPIYFVARGELGNGIWAILAFAVLGVVVMHRTGTQLAGAVGGAAAALALLALPRYTLAAREIMTDIPGAVLGLVCLWLFVRWSGSKPRIRDSLIAGALVALAFAIRSVYLSLLLPFAWRAWRSREHRAVNFAALLAPLAIVLAVNAFYNQTTFGDWRRTGYQFWCAVPYDYFDLVFSLSYFRTNLESLLVPEALWPMALGAFGALAILIRRPPHWREVLGFSAVTAAPIVAVHLLYFFADTRFFLYLLALSMVIGGIGCAALLPARVREQPLIALALLACAFPALPPLADRMSWGFDERFPPRRTTAELVFRETPDDAIVICDLEAPYLAALAPPGSRRTFLAATRRIEFASKVVVLEAVPRELALPVDAFDHAAPGLLAHGGRWAVLRPADRMHDQIEAWVRAGKPVFFETLYVPIPAATKRMLRDTLRFEQPGARLTRIVLAE